MHLTLLLKSELLLVTLIIEIIKVILSLYHPLIILVVLRLVRHCEVGLLVILVESSLELVLRVVLIVAIERVMLGESKLVIWNHWL